MIATSKDILKKGMWPRSFPLWMSVLYLALFIIRPWEKMFPVLAHIHLERTYAILMIIVVTLSSRARFKGSPQTFGVVVFVLSLGVSVLLAFNTTLAWDAFYVVLTIFISYIVFIMVVRTPYELVFLITGYIATMALYLSKAQWEFWVHGEHRYDQGVIRLCGIEYTYGGPNDLAMSVVVSLPMLLFLWVSRDAISAEWTAIWKKRFSRFLKIYAVLAMSSIVLTNSRSGMLSMFCFIAFVSLKGKGFARKLGTVAGGLVVLLVIWLLMPTENQQRFETIWNPEAGPVGAEISAQGRIEGMKTGIEIFSRYPVTGVGINNTAYYRGTQMDGAAFQAHNLLGQLLGETGLIGAAGFSLLVLITVYGAGRAKKLCRAREDDTAKVLFALGVAIQQSIFLMLLEGFFGHNLMRYNWFWLAAFSSLCVQFAVQRSREIGQQDVYGTVVPTVKQ